jgi:lysophospholipase
LETAPYRADLAEGPDEVQAVWVTASDDARLRVAVWPSAGGKGTILLFPGRTEYIEKYGRVAHDLTKAGYAVASIDWRGQGFSDRLAGDRLLGHVLRFRDYQRDVAALLEVVQALDLPSPLFLLAHSMGGCIGLRALIEGLPVARAVFSAPMWGIYMSPRQRRLAAVLPTLARLARQGMRYTPGSREIVYEVGAAFDGNPLTNDPDHFAYLSRQLQEEEQFLLAGPSLHWLGEALAECRRLHALPRPGLPVLTFVGTDETIVSTPDIQRMHEGWAQADLRVVNGARHELMMETPERRDRFLEEKLAFLEGNLPV